MSKWSGTNFLKTLLRQLKDNVSFSFICLHISLFFIWRTTFHRRRNPTCSVEICTLTKGRKQCFITPAKRKTQGANKKLYLRGDKICILLAKFSRCGDLISINKLHSEMTHGRLKREAPPLPLDMSWKRFTSFTLLSPQQIANEHRMKAEICLENA